MFISRTLATRLVVETILSDSGSPFFIFLSFEGSIRHNKTFVFIFPGKIKTFSKFLVEFSKLKTILLETGLTLLILYKESRTQCLRS